MNIIITPLDILSYFGSIQAGFIQSLSGHLSYGWPTMSEALFIPFLLLILCGVVYLMSRQYKSLLPLFQLLAWFSVVSFVCTFSFMIDCDCPASPNFNTFTARVKSFVTAQPQTIRASLNATSSKLTIEYKNVIWRSLRDNVELSEINTDNHVWGQVLFLNHVTDTVTYDLPPDIPDGRYKVKIDRDFGDGVGIPQKVNEVTVQHSYSDFVPIKKLAAYPEVLDDSTTANVNTTDELIGFQISAEGGGDIWIKRFTFAVNAPHEVKNMRLYAYYDLEHKHQIKFGEYDDIDVRHEGMNYDPKVQIESFDGVHIRAHQTLYFLLKGDVKNILPGEQVETTLLGDIFPFPKEFSYDAREHSNFLWATSSESGASLMTGYGVEDLSGFAWMRGAKSQ